MKIYNAFILAISSLLFILSCTSTKEITTPVVLSDPEATSQIVPAQVEELNNEFKFPYEKFTLDNGLEVILHEDHSDPIVAVATLIHVGSNREKPGKTGFAHFFEHMSFNDSENVPVGANRKLIPEWGGTRNGGTWGDGTIYYEVVPTDAFDKILWIDSDRLGYMIKTVTKEALEREKQVVKNEKRQRVDNQPYGYTNEIIRSNLYPKDHPYNWTTIGQLPDLQAATLEDVKEFYDEFYGAGNASLVIVGDIDVAETKKKVAQWFGEIPRGPEVPAIQPRPGVLTESKHLYFEDDFAKLPEIRFVFPTVEEYHPDTYALQILGRLLSGSRKSALYNEVVEINKLAPNVGSYQSSAELAGTFVIRARANEDVDLDKVKAAIEVGLQNFETNGFTDNELQSIKAELETSLFFGIETVLNKAYQLVQDNEFAGNPTQIIEDSQKTLAVDREDVMRVFEKYIKGKNYLMTSFVPKGKLDLIVEGSELATVWKEEVKEGGAEEEVSQGEEAVYEKTPTIFDRSEPEFGETPLFKMPEIWDASLSNGMKIYGTKNYEVPLVAFNMTIDGGHFLDPIEKPGISNLLVDMMMEGTANKTAAELEEAVSLLGASLNASFNNEEIIISGSCLSKNFEQLIELMEETLLEPKWDEDDLVKLKAEIKTTLKDREARPNSIAFGNLYKLIYGKDHILSTSGLGDLKTIDNITMEDLKTLYAKLSPKNSNFHIVGAIDQKRVVNALQSLQAKWNNAANVSVPKFELPTENVHAGKIYFIDVPGSKQSTIFAGNLTVPSSHPDFQKIKFANEILGGGSSGRLMQTLRIEKGYTYGASSFLRDAKETVPFVTYTSVRANATLASLEIIQDMLQNYHITFSEDDAAITKNKLLKQSTRTYESLGAKLGLLRSISKYGKSNNFLEEEQATLINMTVEDFRSIIKTYLAEDQLVYVIVGDAETQLAEVNKLGKGDAIQLDIYGNLIDSSNK